MTRRTRFQAVLFDLDGTLVDSAPDLGDAANRMRERRGLPPLDEAYYRPRASSGARGMIEAAFGLTPDHPAFDAYKAEYLDTYGEVMTRRTRPFDGVESLIAALEDAGLPWGVVTNKIERFALPLTAALPLFRSAGTVIGGDTTPHPKPHPAPLLEAARRLGVEPAACVYVGDDERDIVAGRAAGMATVAARYGYLGVDADVATWGAEAIIDGPLDLLNFLELP
ncbi:phosphoglycolate phosphatase [Tepidimonas taiwanensis]|uniref:phosphoglycolate phosphatase n=1 Tax=Tepidimonas taiwanensis TaxID=307486 RepID=A0A554X8K6_9BURK|nr:phosphoglycolate phosphatase [Tepidimonas taiwanensis]MCX7692107.1 phosphoglycolate phosphatase [Tepidimonas taiwanensis]MDM7464203.1 phosphoglycolate phosphatase [Tepidimonas taiwanensis]TSE32163.1 Phosphoglycolate phosphatase [Tepidimonas taiwanensis]UBQ06042.1 phosphoglycolate phosphatase [Tepidimonas taiwanensis]